MGCLAVLDGSVFLHDLPCFEVLNSRIEHSVATRGEAPSQRSLGEKLCLPLLPAVLCSLLGRVGLVLQHLLQLYFRCTLLGLGGFQPHHHLLFLLIQLAKQASSLFVLCLLLLLLLCLLELDLQLNLPAFQLLHLCTPAPSLEHLHHLLLLAF